MENGSTDSSGALGAADSALVRPSPGPKASLFSCAAVLSSQDLSAAAFVICLTSAMFEEGPSTRQLENLGTVPNIEADDEPKNPVSPSAANTTARSASAPRRELGCNVEVDVMAA